MATSPEYSNDWLFTTKCLDNCLDGCHFLDMEILLALLATFAVPQVPKVAISCTECITLIELGSMAEGLPFFERFKTYPQAVRTCHQKETLRTLLFTCATLYPARKSHPKSLRSRTKLPGSPVTAHVDRVVALIKTSNRTACISLKSGRRRCSAETEQRHPRGRRRLLNRVSTEASRAS